MHCCYLSELTRGWVGAVGDWYSFPVCLMQWTNEQCRSHRRSLGLRSLPDAGDGSYTSPGFRAVQMCLSMLLAVDLCRVCDRPTSRNIRGTVCYSAAYVQHLPDRLPAVLSNV